MGRKALYLPFFYLAGVHKRYTWPTPVQISFLLPAALLLSAVVVSLTYTFGSLMSRHVTAKAVCLISTPDI